MPAAPGELTRLFSAIVGSEQVRADPGPPWTVGGLPAPVVVFPGSVDEVAGCLREASRQRLAVAPAGLGARLHWGAAPDRLDVVLSLRRLDRVLAWEPADLTMSVQAGVTLAALGRHLARRGQFLPIDVPYPEHTTIGGLVATAAAGPYRARYGTIRDLLLGVTAIRADGTSVRGGGRVVKNVTGYDVTKLFVGALGTLGVVVECHLRLHPRPVEEQSWVFGFASAGRALAAATRARHTSVSLSRLQLLDAGALEALGVGEAEAALALTVGSVPAAVEAQGREIAGLCRAEGGRDLAVGEPDAWWAATAGVAWAAPPEDAVALRIGTRPVHLGVALAAVDGSRSSTARLRISAEIAHGVLHARLDGVAPHEVAGLVAGVRRELARVDGTAVVEHAPASARPGLDVWGDVGPALAPMQRLKAELDPERILNPGRFVGGI